jgi:hypothetical protein
MATAAAEDDCLPNIGPAGRRRRHRGGLVTFAVALAVAAALLATRAARPWRLALLPLFWAAAVGVFQAREKT